MKKTARFFLALALALCASLAVLPAHSGGSLTLLKSGSAGAGPPISITYNGNAAQNGNAYTAVPLGAEDPSRIVVFTMFRSGIGSCAYTPNSTVINGVAATDAVVTTPSGNDLIVQAYAPVPTGTSVNVSVATASCANGAWASHSIYNAASASPDDAQFIVAGASPRSTPSATATAGGVSIGTCTNTTNNSAVVLTGTAIVTTDFDRLIHNVTSASGAGHNANTGTAAVTTCTLGGASLLATALTWH